MIDRPSHDNEITKACNIIPPFDMELDFDVDPLEHVSLDMRIVHEVEVFLAEYFDNREEHFWDVSVIIEEICNNISDHGGKKGYLHIELEYDQLLAQYIAHFVIGDFGPGIKTNIGSLDAFISASASGVGILKTLSVNSQMHLVLHDNEEIYIIHSPEGFTGYNREPKEKRWGKGAHFIGSIILPRRKPDIYSVNIDYTQDNDRQKAMYQAIIEPLFAIFSPDGSPNEFSFHFLGMIAEIMKNIRDHGGKKGYFKYYIDGDILHCMIGDFGAGVKAKAGSYNNFYTEGFSTGTHEDHNYGRGGATVKKNSQKQNISITMFDNGNPEIIHVVDDLDVFLFPDTDVRKGTHFTCSIRIPKN